MLILNSYGIDFQNGFKGPLIGPVYIRTSGALEVIHYFTTSRGGLKLSEVEKIIEDLKKNRPNQEIPTNMYTIFAGICSLTIRNPQTKAISYPKDRDNTTIHQPAV